MALHRVLRPVCGAVIGAGVASALALGGSRAAAQVVNQIPPATIIQPITQAYELGPVLDVVPYVLADGVTIKLDLVPSVRQFIGYDPQPTIAALQQPNTVIVPMVLPVFRIRQVITSVHVWDGQTVVLGGLLSDNTTKIKDKVPFFGDLPLIGRLFQSESTSSTKMNLLIFVTPTIVDPAGNLVHRDEDMPFAAQGIPPQPNLTLRASVPANPPPSARPVQAPPPAEQPVPPQ